MITFWQQIPSKAKDIRTMFVPNPGNVLISVDFKSQEVRLCAHLCGDKKMQKAIKDGLDLYSYCASIVYNVPYEDCLQKDKYGNDIAENKARRDSLKAVFLGIMYGKGYASTALELNINQDEAKNLYQSVFNLFPTLKNFMEDSQRFAKQYGYVTTLSGRKCRLPEILLDPYEYEPDRAIFNDISSEFIQSNGKSIITEHDRAFLQLANRYHNILEGKKKLKFEEVREVIKEAAKKGLKITNNTGTIAAMERKCVNSRVQGSASDQMKVGMIEIYRDTRLRELECKLVLTVHDEVLCECPKDNAKEASEIIYKIFKGVFSDILTVESDCDIEIFECWNGKAIQLS